MVIRSRDLTMEDKASVKAEMTDKPEESRKEPGSGYLAAGAGKLNNERSSLSQDSVTSTGDVISPNGIRLWGMW